MTKSEKINWVDFLNQENYSDEELEKASVYAGNWDTCATTCMEKPEDDYLERLGTIFFYAIRGMHVTLTYKLYDSFKEKKEHAIAVFKDIKLREAELEEEEEMKINILTAT